MTKKILSMALAIAMVMALAVTASAASITVTAPTGAGTETGITYTAYKIFDATISGTNVAYTIEEDSPYYNTVKDSGYFTLTKATGTEKTYVIAKNDNYTDSAANTFADTLKAVTATAAGTLTKQADGTYKLDGLANGYYLVTSSVGTDLILETIGDVSATAKNEYPTIDKVIMDPDAKVYTTADMGEVLKFEITVDIPEDATGEIVVHDDMTGLEYVAMTEVEGITVAQNNNDGCEVHFKLSEAYVNKNKGTEVTIAYTAKLTNEIAANDAWLVDDTYTSNKVHTDVHSTDIIINKVIKGTETPLKDAKFVLKNADGKFYAVDANGVVSWVDAQDDATEVATNDQGVAEFANMANGKYYLVETVAPIGYNLLTEAVEVEVTAVLNAEKTAIVDIVEKVENSAGVELPSTGGIGTTIFYALGAVMVIGAGVLLVAKKRMSVEG